MNNSLVNDDFYQYKCTEYTIGEYYSNLGTLKNVVRGNFLIKPKDQFSFDRYKISIESTIQRLTNEKLPDDFDIDAWHELSFKLTNDYGFLSFNKYMQSIKDEITLLENTDWNWPTQHEHMEKNPFQGESVNEWRELITTVQQTVRRINDESFENSLIKTKKYFIDSSISKYLKGVNPVFNFDSQEIELECESLASAIILSIVSNKRHLMSCGQCHKLFYSKRSDTKYCSQTCGRKNQGDRKVK